MIVGLVGCSKTKAAEPRPAAELYASPLFLYSYRAAKRTCDRVMILSALHGLVDPGEVIAPYDFHVGQLSGAALAAWRDKVQQQLAAVLRPHPRPHRLVFFAGRVYELAMPEIEGAEEMAPLRGLFIGQRIRACKAMPSEAFRGQVLQ